MATVLFSRITYTGYPYLFTLIYVWYILSCVETKACNFVFFTLQRYTNLQQQTNYLSFCLR